MAKQLSFTMSKTFCMNCNGPTKGEYEYLGVILCSSCKAIANHLEKRAEGHLERLRIIYKEKLRVALASGGVKLPPENPPSDTTTTFLPDEDTINQRPPKKRKRNSPTF